MGLIAKILRPFSRLTQNDVPISTEETLEVDPSTLLLTWDSLNERVILSVIAGAGVTFAAVKAALAAASSSVGLNGQDLTGVGAIVAGPTRRAWWRGVTTSGAATATAKTIPLATNSVGCLSLIFVSTDGASSGAITKATVEVSTLGGTFASVNIDGGNTPGFPLAPQIPALTWSAGTLTISVGGPSANITGTAANGSGKLRLTLDGDVQSDITGESVTVSGLSGTPGGNGAHVATWVDGTHIDLAAVSYVAPDTSGTVVETTPRSLTWSGSIELTVTP